MSYYKLTKWEYIKQILWYGFILVGIPWILYFLIRWDFVIGIDEYGSPEYSAHGIMILVGGYWLALLFIHKYRTEKENRKRQLKRLLDGVMNKEEKERLREDLRHQAHFLDEEEMDRLGGYRE